jgi:hypothetical protein
MVPVFTDCIFFLTCISLVCQGSNLGCVTRDTLASLADKCPDVYCTPEGPCRSLEAGWPGSLTYVEAGGTHSEVEPPGFGLHLLSLFCN